MTMLVLHRDGVDWRLDLTGDWSLQGLAQIDAELAALPGPLTERIRRRDRRHASSR